jgi:hypothetical protein
MLPTEILHLIVENVVSDGWVVAKRPESDYEGDLKVQKRPVPSLISCACSEQQSLRS